MREQSGQERKPKCLDALREAYWQVSNEDDFTVCLMRWYQR